MFKGLKKNSDHPTPADSPADAAPSGGIVMGKLQGKPSKKHLVLAGIALVALVAIAVYIVQKYNNESTHKAHVYTGTLYSTKGSGNNSGLTFNAASDGIKTWYDDSSNPNLKMYLHYVQDPKDSSKSIYVARIASSSNSYPANHEKDVFLQGLKENLTTDPDSAKFKKDTKPLKDFVDLVYSDTKGTVKLGGITAFYNPSIKSDAYSLGVTVHDASGKLPDQKGTALWISGKDNYYHFLVAADASDWKKNLDYYQQILQSIKIDQ